MKALVLFGLIIFLFFNNLSATCLQHEKLINAELKELELIGSYSSSTNFKKKTYYNINLKSQYACQKALEEKNAAQKKYDKELLKNENKIDSLYKSYKIAVIKKLSSCGDSETYYTENSNINMEKFISKISLPIFDTLLKKDHFINSINRVIDYRNPPSRILRYSQDEVDKSYYFEDTDLKLNYFIDLSTCPDYIIYDLKLNSRIDCSNKSMKQNSICIKLLPILKEIEKSREKIQIEKLIKKIPQVQKM